jgi:hypothetical protein
LGEMQFPKQLARQDSDEAKIKAHTFRLSTNHCIITITFISTACTSYAQSDTDKINNTGFKKLL